MTAMWSDMNWNFLDPKLVFKHFLKGLFQEMVNSNYAKCTEIKGHSH